MTGFGSARATSQDVTATVEVRTVNARHLEPRFRIPPDFSHLELRLDAILKKSLGRGRVEVSVDVRRTTGLGTSPRIDEDLVEQYRDRLESLARKLGVPFEPKIETLVGLPGVLKDPSSTWPDGIESTIETVMDAAVADLLRSRAHEGLALRTELSARITEVEDFVRSIETEIPASKEARRARALERLRTMAEGSDVDPARLAQEAALLAERSDVTEELARLNAHVEHFRAQLEVSEPVGRKLDFLIQEAFREANTLGQKAPSAAIVHRIVELKSALERLREQVQNVE